MMSRVGRITLVQESRFQLLEDDGRATVFILGHRAGIEPQDLPALQGTGSRVQVESRPAPGLVAETACSIRILERGPPGRREASQ